ncbi:MAG: radical SAM protein [Desulfovibrio sp.]|jgi:oxygen-independent coproporphyrinogen-3 oxidase|nr:radical SAM protein [Desulfovibrio sp.]
MLIHPELPIYELAGPGGTVLLYTPGTLAVVTGEQALLLRQVWNGGTETREDVSLWKQSGWLLDHARSAVAARTRWLAEEYRPECLTVYLSNRCSLRCSYCFAAPARTVARSGGCLRPDAFAAAAELVGRNCADMGRVFQLACHGGGEPTLHWDLVRRLVGISKAVAERHAVPWSGYIATNGVVPLKLAREMAAIFGRVGLSCDGPPDIQDRQRPSSDGAPTSGRVRRTAVALKEAGARLDLRATITPETVSRQAEILEYLAVELGADNVAFEPVYSAGAGGGGGTDPEEWAGHFMRAKRAALRHNVALTFSGFRPDEHHGPYCNVLRQSLHLTPDGRATNCFLVVDGDHPGNSSQIIGGFDRRSGRFALDRDKTASLRERASGIGAGCRACFAAYHCARSCPDDCALQDDLHTKLHSNEFECSTPKILKNRKSLIFQKLESGGFASATQVRFLSKANLYHPSEKAAEASFRCRLNRAVGRALINETALELLREEARASAAASRGQAAADVITKTLGDLPRPVREEVLRAWKASQPYYHLENRRLPAPLWEKKGFQYDGDATWDRLRQIVNAGPARPFSIYAHVPFCEKRCGFCDCYTCSARPGHPLQTVYARRLRLDLQQWSERTALAAWPVTTVHFGGGTPNYLQPSVFASVVEAVRAGFHTSRSTEWALESTAHLLTGPHLDFLWSLGFRRLHIGVQTLEEPLRREIGRREPPETVLKRIADCLERGFVTTADLLYGLPGQSVTAFFSGIDRLDRLGIHGISLYGFNQSGRNRGFLRRYSHSPDIIKDFAMFAAADSKLTRAGYDKNHFCHYARPQDRNLYYNHARRGEDLLAVGASADGVFADLHYRCPQLSKKFLEVARSYPLFQGSIVESEENFARSTIAKHLMTGSIHKDLLCAEELDGIIGRWLDCLLIREKKDDSDMFELTGNGSWHLCAMLEELEE